MVDDSPDIATLILAYSHGQPIEVIIAETVKAGFERAQQSRFDLVLMDYHLPDGSGAEAVRQLRHWEHRQQMRPTAIFAMTDLTNFKSGEEMLNAGCTALIGKPLSRAGFLSVAARHRRHASSAVSD